MGKKKCADPLVLKCVTFNLNAGGGLMVQTDMYLTIGNNSVTLQFCGFGGSTSPGQVSTTAQNCKIPKDCRPLCDQTFLISAKDAAASESQIMKLVITRDGEITFVLSLSGSGKPEFPVFDGSSVTWLVFGCSC